MKKINIALSLFLAAVLLLGGCSAQKAKVNIPNAAKLSNGYVEEKTLVLADDARLAHVKQNMELMLSNETAELYLGKYYDIALVDRRTGAVAYSNEAAYLAGSENFSADQQKNAYSQIIIDYFRKDGAAVTVHSFPECFDGNEKKQIEAEKTANVLKLKYSFGTVMESRVIFQVMTADTFKSITEKAEDAVADKKLSSSKWGRMKACYNHIIYDKLSSSDQKRYKETYPSFKSGDEIYVLNPSATYIQTDNIEVVCKELGLTRADVDAEEEKVGGSASLESTIPNFEVTLEYTLEKADLIVNVEISEIVEPKNFYIDKVYVLPSFGASAVEDEGYLLLPDGTGSIVLNEKQTSGSDQLTVEFYGSDPALNIINRDDAAISASFPIFGIKRGDTAVFGIVESLDAMSGIVAGTVNNNRLLNNISPWFRYRIGGSIEEGDGSSAKNKVYSKKIPTQPYNVRYHLLYGERSTYSGMAAYYREYLLNTEQLKKENTSVFEVDVSLIGGITAQKSILGVSTAATVAASDLASAQKWLKELGAVNISVAYEGMFNSGIESSVPTKLKIIKDLGNESEYASFLKKENAWVSLSFMQASKGGNGISGTADISKFINKEYAFLAEYAPHSGERIEEQKRFLISPAKYAFIIEKMTSSLKPFTNKLVLKDAASLLSSDFNESKNMTREDSKLLVCETLEKAEKSGALLKLGGANAYALKYASALTDVTTNTEKMRLIDASVPFVGMVLHGVIQYSVSPLNEAGNYEMAVLDMLEMGANPSFRLITGDMQLLSDTEYTQFNSASAAVWGEKIKSLYDKTASFSNAVSDSYIVSHETDNGLIFVTYSNGYRAVINRSVDDIGYGDMTVGGHSFLLLNEKGGEI